MKKKQNPFKKVNFLKLTLSLTNYYNITSAFFCTTFTTFLSNCFLSRITNSDFEPLLHSNNTFGYCWFIPK